MTDSVNTVQLLSKKPRWSIRMKYLTLGVLLMLVDDIVRYPQNAPLNYAYLALFCTVAVSLATVECRKIWTLQAKRTPRWVTIAGSLAVASAVIVLLELGYRGLFVWNHLYLIGPMLLFFAVLAVGEWITEWEKPVRVYIGLEGYFFVSTTASPSNDFQPRAETDPK